MIEISADQLRRAQQMLQHVPNGVEKATARAINRAAESGKTIAVRTASQLYVIRGGEIRETINLSKASAGNLFAAIKSRGRVRPLSKFKIKAGSRNPIKQLHANVKKGGGGTIKGAFVARMNAVGFGSNRRVADPGQGHVGIFRRLEGNKRNPIREMYGPSVPQMLENETVWQRVEEKEWETLQNRMEHEVGRMFEGGGR